MSRRFPLTVAPTPGGGTQTLILQPPAAVVPPVVCPECPECPPFAEWRPLHEILDIASTKYPVAGTFQNTVEGPNEEGIWTAHNIDDVNLCGIETTGINASEVIIYFVPEDLTVVTEQTRYLYGATSLIYDPATYAYNPYYRLQANEDPEVSNIVLSFYQKIGGMDAPVRFKLFGLLAGTTPEF